MIINICTLILETCAVIKNEALIFCGQVTLLVMLSLDLQYTVSYKCFIETVPVADIAWKAPN